MRAFSRALLPRVLRNRRKSGEERARKQNPTKATMATATGRENEARSDFRGVSEGDSAWLVFPAGGLIRDGAQGRTKSEARFRQTEARVQHEWGRVGARTRALCVLGHRDGSHRLPPAPARHTIRNPQRGWRNMDEGVVDAVSLSQEQSIFRVSRTGEDHDFPSWWPSLLSGEVDSQE